MNLDAASRGLLVAATLWVALAAAGGFAQTLFYSEIERDGRIYVFADARSCDLFQKGGEMGNSITRPSYGPNGETVVFDSEEAISLYNFKHGLPGESFKKPEEKPKSPYPSGKVNGLVFGDYYWFSDHHDPKIDGQQGFWLRRAYLGYDHAFSDDAIRPPAARDEQQRPARGRGPGALREGRLRDVEVPPRAPGATRDPALAHLRLRGGVLGPAAHREDAGRPLPDRLLARSRPRLQRTDRRERPALRRSARQRRGQRIGDGPATRSSGSRGSSRAGPACCSRATSTTASGRAVRTARRPRASRASGAKPSAPRPSISGRSASRGRPTSRARRSRSGLASRSGISSRRRGASSAASTT